jgi:hypothetical protein
MTVIFNVGRRVPRNWYKRTANRVKGLLTFQENIWQMITSSIKLAKRKSDADGRLTFLITKDNEIEDLHFQIEWMKVMIKGSPEMEEDEYKDCLKFYDKLSKHFKKDFPVDPQMSKHFKSKVLSAVQIEEAYSKGYGTIENDNIVNKLLEMGILTYIDWKKDFLEREDILPITENENND